MGLFVAAVGTGVSPAQTDKLPVRRLVHSSVKVSWVYKTLSKQQTMSVVLHPVITQPFRHCREEIRSKIGKLSRFAKYQKPGVVPYEVEVFELTLFFPLYPAVTGGAHKSICLPRRDSQPLSLMLSYVARTSAGELFEAKVVMFSHESLPLKNFFETHYSHYDILQGKLRVIVL